MKWIIDHLTDATDWTITAPAGSTVTKQEFRQFIAGSGNDGSIKIEFVAGAGERYAEKIFPQPIDVTEAETLVISVYASGFENQGPFGKPPEFRYKLSLGGGVEYLIPATRRRESIEIGIEEVTEISKLRLTALHEDADTVIISECVAERPEMILDLNLSIQEELERLIQGRLAEAYNLGTVTGTTGDTTITLDTPPHLERYGVIRISDGVNEEIHQVLDNDGSLFHFGTNFDGGSLVNSFTNANVYLDFPVYFGQSQEEIFLPGITVWGVEPEAKNYTGKLDIITDSWKEDGTSKQRVEGQHYEIEVMITCQARSQGLLEEMSKVARLLIAGEILWVNGRRWDIADAGRASELSENAGETEYIPQIQYRLRIIQYEDINQREFVPVTVSTNVDVEVVE
jgi:hypothetical protein